MGYSTSFTGKLLLSKPLEYEDADAINRFCRSRQEGSEFPSHWCDWETDGRRLYWNGNEKSYGMARWLEILVSRFLAPKGVSVSGKLFARGESDDDNWFLIAEDNKVTVKKLDLEEIGVTGRD